MAWDFNLLLVSQVLLAFFLGGIIGFEREVHHSPAGIRTYAAVCLGACVFGLVSNHAHGSAVYHSIVDPTRIAAQVASGIGFIGAGVIFRDGMNTNGLTTAATIWATAAIGLAVSFTMFTVAVLTTVLILVLLILPYVPGWNIVSAKRKRKKREV